VVLALLGLRLALGLPPFLPPLIGDRPLPPGFLKVLRASTKVVRFLERWVRPRKDKWLSRPAGRFVNGGLLTLMAVFLALPLPPLIPLSNTLPAYAILFLALSIMEEDGVLIWVAYAVAAITCGYFYFLADLIIVLIGKYADPVLGWFRSWL
jgi:hypothetical protein